MSIFSKIGKNIYDFLDKKVDNGKIETVYSSLTSLRLKEIAFYIASTYIANTIGRCEFQVYENGELVKNELYYALNMNPNPNYSGPQFKNKLMHQYFCGDGALIIPKGRKNLYVADGFNVDKSTGLKDWNYTGIQIDDYTDPRTYKASDVFHIKQDNKNIQTLINSLYADYNQIIASAVEQFKNSNGKKYKLNIGGYQAGDPNFNKIYTEVVETQLKDFLKKPTAVYPQFNGYDLEEVGNGQKQGVRGGSVDIIALRKESFEIVAQIFKIPLPLLLGNITNIQEIAKVFLTFCVSPIANVIGDELTKKYYTYAEWKNNSYIKVDTTHINHFDIIEVANSVEKLISSGTMCVDEVRGILGMPLLNTEFSKTHFMTKNFQTAEESLKPENGKEVLKDE